MIKTFLNVAVLALAALAFDAAQAHGGATARHGGIVQMASDLSFELVAVANGVAIYVEDHGKPMPPAGMSGKLTVLAGAEKSEAPLVVDNDRLLAKGIKLGSGAKAVAALTTAEKKAITVRFTIR